MGREETTEEVDGPAMERRPMEGARLPWLADETVWMTGVGRAKTR